MIGILLITHTPLASAFIEAASHVFRARPERIEAIDVIADQDTHQVHELARTAIGRINDGSGVLVLTDMMGGTPSNCCSQLAVKNEVATIAGVSLPMLIRALSYRNEPLDVVVEKALAGAQNGTLRVD
jgi:mannose PTS system EIIA component